MIYGRPAILSDGSGPCDLRDVIKGEYTRLPGQAQIWMVVEDGRKLSDDCFLLLWRLLEYYTRGHHPSHDAIPRHGVRLLAIPESNGQLEKTT